MWRFWANDVLGTLVAHAASASEGGSRAAAERTASFSFPTFLYEHVSDFVQMAFSARTTPRGWKHQVGALISGLSIANVTTNSTSTAQGYAPGDIVWGPCSDNTTLSGAECGYAIVPLDYLNTTAGVAKIALGRYNATASPRKGSVFVNPGGPGGTGVDLATFTGDELQQILGEEYDIIGFDPRGIGQTEPATKCFLSPEARTAFIANTILDRGYDVGPNLTDPENRYQLIQSQKDVFTLYQTEMEICAQTMGDQLRYMGTSTVARDIDYITTILDGEDALIHFYGLSYGTVIGQYLVNMFPNRVGRVAIDGVVDGNAWANDPYYTWDRTWLNSTDDAYKLFFEDCAKAGPSGCALAKSNDTGSTIMDRVETFINQLYDTPMPVPNASIPGILTNGRARLFFLGSLESPTDWPTTAEAFAAAMAGDGSAVLDTTNTQYLVDMERLAVSCNDNKPFSPPSAETIIDEALYVLGHVSRFALSSPIAEPDGGCQYWPVTPPERYAGPWNNTLNNPVLIVSNTNDPATPLVNGKTVHTAMGSNNSALLVQDSPGHTSLALTSLCTISYLRAFFANGTLPDAGTVCSVDASAFPDASSTNGTATNVVTASKAKTLFAQGQHPFSGLRKLVLGS